MKRNGISSLAVAAAAVLGLSVAQPAAGASLVDSLVSQLGISKTQATGGLQALLQATKGRLSPTDYASLLQGAPELEELAKTVATAEGAATDAAHAADSHVASPSEKPGTPAAPVAAKTEGTASSNLLAAASDAASALGKSPGGLDLSALGNLTGLTSQFQKLGLDAGMVQKFVPVVLGYFGQSSGTASLLQKGLGLL
jgi:hypothetical protein